MLVFGRASRTKAGERRLPSPLLSCSFREEQESKNEEEQNINVSSLVKNKQVSVSFVRGTRPARHSPSGAYCKEYRELDAEKPPGIWQIMRRANKADSKRKRGAEGGNYEAVGSLANGGFIPRVNDPC